LECFYIILINTTEMGCRFEPRRSDAYFAGVVAG
jgi:hypothetical protein